MHQGLIDQRSKNEAGIATVDRSPSPGKVSASSTLPASPAVPPAGRIEGGTRTDETDLDASMAAAMGYVDQDGVQAGAGNGRAEDHSMDAGVAPPPADAGAIAGVPPAPDAGANAAPAADAGTGADASSSTPAPAPGPAPSPPRPPPTLTVQSTALDLMDTNRLELTSGGAGARYKFEIKRSTGGTWHTFEDGTSNVFSGVCRIAGHFKVRGEVTASGSSQVSAEQDVEVRFPAYSTIVADSAVQAATAAAWASTLAATTRTSRREEGFWVLLNTAGAGTYSASATGTGTPVGPADGATINLPPKPADNPASPTPGVTPSVQYTVASFHTHTPTTYRTVPRVVGPSSDDGAADRSDNVVGIVYDYVAVSAGAIPAGHPLNSAAQRYQSGGPNRRSTPP